MRVPDRCLADLRERGYLLFEGFLEADELAAAQEALWLHYPRPEAYFADPAAHAWLATDQWAGEVSGPWRSWNLNRLAFHPDLLDLAERFLGRGQLVSPEETLEQQVTPLPQVRQATVGHPHPRTLSALAVRPQRHSTVHLLRVTAEC